MTQHSRDWRIRVEGSAGDRVVCQDSADRLSGPPFIVVKDAAQPFLAHDSGTHVDHARRFLDQLIVEPLMIPLDVVVLCVLLHRVAQVLLSQWNDLVQTLRLDRTHEARRVGIQIRASRGKFHGLDT